MGTIIFDNDFINRYSKKILGFAYKKTFNIWDAEDLSQDILIALSNALKNRSDIKDMDGFIYTVCCHVWSNFYRKNKNRFKNDTNLSDAIEIPGNSVIEDEFILREDIEKLRKQVSYLSQIHREITVMFYYEEKKGEEIAEIMKIPHSTIRWHLSVIRKKLKEGFEMRENLNFKPQKLSVGHNGWTHGVNMHGLYNDLLVQNIAIACYGEALSIESIAHKLGVAAAYIENHIKNLVYMDYLKVVDNHKFQTNFFISEKKHSDYSKEYILNNIEPIALKLHGALVKRIDDIINIGFIGSDLDKNFIIWSILPVLINSINWSIKDRADEACPLRKDGSQHWVAASFVYENTEPDISILAKAFGNGMCKTRGNSFGVRAMQTDISVTGVGWRDFNGTPDLDNLYRIKMILENGEEPNQNDKLIISGMANKGYVEMVDGKPKIMIPYFNAEEYEKYEEILNAIIKELGDDFASEFVESYAKGFDALIPDFIEKDERANLTGGICPVYEILIYLAETGNMSYPKNSDEAKRLCTLVWET
jgi:RNA polymerase sigma factor (sigma-70 family)